MRLAALVILLAATGTAQAQAVMAVRGTIVDRATKEPIGGAIITAGGEFAASEDDGTFVIALPVGTTTLEITAAWLVTKRVPVTVPAGATAVPDLVIEVEPSESGGETIEVVDIAPEPPGTIKIDAGTARAVPGGGDAAKVVHSLPAVARPPAGSAEIVVWGAAPRDTRVFVDGVPVPSLYHLGGYRAAVGNDLVGDIRLAPAAFGPDRGRAIGGVIDIGYGDPKEAPQWRVQADVLDASGAGRIDLGKVTIALAARQSWLDRAIDLVADPETLAPNAPLPRWSDGQLVIRAELAEHLELSGWVIGALDRLDRTLASDDPATETTQRIDRKMVRGQVTLVHRRPGSGSERITLWGGRDRASDSLLVGLTPAAAESAAWVAGARAIQERRLHDAVSLIVGLDLDGERMHLVRSGSLSIPAREGDPQIFGQPPGDDVNADDWYATTIDAAAYATTDLRLGRLTFTGGLRLDGWVLGASRLTPRVGTTPEIATQQITFSLDPRGAVQVRLTDEAVARIDGGRYHQARAASDTSAVFGTPDLGLEQAWHVTAGGQWKRGVVAVEAVGYARWLDDLVARDLALTPLLANSLTQAGTGTVFGAQLTARVVGWQGLSGWLSYGLSRSRRQDAELAPERFFDRDQTHGFIAVGGWRHGPWSLGARVRIATGEPRTGVVGSFFDSRSGRFQPIRGPQNGVRLPTFFAADLRAERRFPHGAVYVEVQNLTGRANAEELIYSADFSQQNYLTGLPLLAIAGLRIEG